MYIKIYISLKKKVGELTKSLAMYSAKSGKYDS